MSEFSDIQALVNLFNPPKNNDNSDSDCDYDDKEENPIEPNKQNPKTIKLNPYSKVEDGRNVNKSCDEQQFLESQEHASSDWKKTPKWDISYRQKVTSSDVFLNMGAKTPSTASCEDMIVTIDLPGEKMQNMDIKVFAQQLEISSPNFGLKIPLPQPVHPQKGDAKWDKEREQLVVTLRMEREFDFVNF